VDLEDGFPTPSATVPLEGQGSRVASLQGHTAATPPSDPSPLSEAGGKGAAVLPLTWMPSQRRGCRAAAERGVSIELSAEFFWEFVVDPTKECRLESVVILSRGFLAAKDLCSLSAVAQVFAAKDAAQDDKLGELTKYQRPQS
jgi:hypothetical protein